MMRPAAGQNYPRTGFPLEGKLRWRSRRGSELQSPAAAAAAAPPGPRATDTILKVSKKKKKLDLSLPF